MQPEYQVIAVAGAAGGLGQIISKELLQIKEFQVKVLTRSENVSDAKKKVLEELKASGATLVTVNYENEDDLKKSLEGVQVVISTFNGPALGNEQVRLVQAAKAAKVKRFIPSEYGIDGAVHHPEPFALGKAAIRKSIIDSEMEYSFFYTGLFTDTTFFPWFGFDTANNRVQIVGKGETPVSFTHRVDVAKCVVQSLLFPEKTRNAEIRMATNTMSLVDVVTLMKKKGLLSKDTAKIEHLDKEEVVAKIKACQYGVQTFPEQLQVLTEDGRAEIKKPNINEFANINPITIDNYFDSLN